MADSKLDLDTLAEEGSAVKMKPWTEHFMNCEVCKKAMEKRFSNQEQAVEGCCELGTDLYKHFSKEVDKIWAISHPR